MLNDVNFVQDSSLLPAGYERMSTRRDKTFARHLRLLASALALASLSMGATTGVQAHPSYAMFDMTQNVMLTGIVERFDYAIPHSWLHVSVPEEAGGKRTISLEMTGIPDLFRQGIKSTTLYPGLGVTVLINPMRGNRPGGLWRGHVDGTGAIFGEFLDLLPEVDAQEETAP